MVKKNNQTHVDRSINHPTTKETDPVNPPTAQRFTPAPYILYTKLSTSAFFQHPITVYHSVPKYNDLLYTNN